MKMACEQAVLSRAANSRGLDLRGLNSKGPGGPTGPLGHPVEGP